MENYGLPCVVSINKFTFDTAKEIEIIKTRMSELGVSVVLAEHWAGGEGAEELAKEVVELVDKGSAQGLFMKIVIVYGRRYKVATKIYGASNVTASSKVKKQLSDWENAGFGKYPICVAKTQSSFSTDASVRGSSFKPFS